jgi:predicted nucleotidyltransferase
MRSEYSSSVRVFYPKFDRKTIIETLKQKVDALKKKLHVSMVVLFGSYAKDSYTVNSDIDLLIVYRGEVKDAYEIAKRTISIYGVEPHTYSEEEYREMRMTIRKMIEGGVQIYVEPGFDD